MADVQLPGDVRRRDHDAETRFGRRRLGLEDAHLRPEPLPLVLIALGVEALVHLSALAWSLGLGQCHIDILRGVFNGKGATKGARATNDRKREEALFEILGLALELAQ